jgi:hypothetical protein
LITQDRLRLGKVQNPERSYPHDVVKPRATAAPVGCVPAA